MKGRGINMKLKGIVLEETFRRIINNSVKNTIDVATGGIRYWTEKSRFLAKKRGVMYWEIYQIRGEE
jgi:hypothetical protein